MSDFFRPPPSHWSEEASGGEPPPWTGRPQGAPPGEVVSELVLASSDRATVSIAYVDAYPDGFEVVIAATTTFAERDLRREGDDSGADVFGRHWPTVGERRDAIPPQLLRFGVQFADGRTATNITGHDLPAAGPTLWPLRGGGSGGRASGWSFDQGYWVSPLPASGSVALVCEWPIARIPLVRHEVEARRMHDAADRARALFPKDQRVLRDGREWRLGTDADVAWINDGTSGGTGITAAIPAVFASYCTLALPPRAGGAELAHHERAVLGLLTEQTAEQPWWLGYLDTGPSDVVFPYGPRATVYRGYGYVLVEAGPRQAAGWRKTGFNWALPDLMFPADRSWLLSTMWDDAWTSIGGSERLVSSVLACAELATKTHRVTLRPAPRKGVFRYACAAAYQTQ